MNILIYQHDHTFSLDKIVIPYLKKQSHLFTMGKNEADFTIHKDGSFNKKAFTVFLQKNNITHFLYCENNSFLPQVFNALPEQLITVMILTDTNTGIKKRIPYVELFDILFVICTQHIPQLRKYNLHVYPIQYGVDTTYFYKKKNIKKTYDVSFVGHIVPWVHYERLFLMMYLRLRGMQIHYTTAAYKSINAIFNESHIVLNKTPLNGFNMRVFEVFGSGSLLLNDFCEENGMTKIFLPEKHIVYYKSFEDCYNKIRYYIKHDDERERIANAGHSFAVQNYSWDKQINKLLRGIQKVNKLNKTTKKYTFFHLSKLETDIFRNKEKALYYLKKAYTIHEVNFYTYISYYCLYVFKLSLIKIILRIVALIFR